MNRVFKNLMLLTLCSSIGLISFQKKAFAQQPSWDSVVTAKVNLDSVGAFGMYVADINNDFYPDLLTLRAGWGVNIANAVRVYMNIQDTSSSNPQARMFVDVTNGSGVNAMPDSNDTSRSVLVVALADINNDGNIDMVRGNYYHDDPVNNLGDRFESFLGDGMGHFTLVPNNGLHNLGLVNATGCSFLDYNKDGKIDLFIASWFTKYTANIWHTGYLLRGNGDGTFTNVTNQAGITKKEPMYGCSALDWNNDGWPDILTAPYCRTGGQLLKNNKDGTFTDVAAFAHYNAQKMSGDNGQRLCMWSNVPQDFDNDGDMDIYFSLVHGGNDANEGHSTIVMNSGASNNYELSWDLDRITWKAPQSSHRGDYDASWLDWDNDGLMDLVTAQGHYMPTTDRIFVLHQQQDHSFLDVTQDMGLIKTETHNLHLLEVFDYDLDGDDDVIFSSLSSGQPLQLIENKKGQDNNWVGVRLNAPADVNKSSIGARIYVWSGGVKRMREIYAGRGNQAGQQPFAFLFGLGHNNSIDSIMVAWPDSSNSFTVVKNPDINQYIEIGPNVNGTLGISKTNQPVLNPTLKLYPNPAKDYILIQLSNNNTPEHVEIYNSIGQRMDKVKIYKNSMATQLCSIEKLSAGIYFVKVTDKHHQVYKASFIKQ